MFGMSFSIDDQGEGADCRHPGLIRHKIDIPFGEYLVDVAFRYLERAQYAKRPVP